MIVIGFKIFHNLWFPQRPWSSPKCLTISKVLWVQKPLQKWHAFGAFMWRLYNWKCLVGKMHKSILYYMYLIDKLGILSQMQMHWSSLSSLKYRFWLTRLNSQMSCWQNVLVNWAIPIVSLHRYFQALPTLA